MIKIDYNAKLKNILDEFLRSNQVCFDKFELQCGEFVEKLVECEQKLVEVQIKRYAVMVREEHFQNKSRCLEEEAHVRYIDHYPKMVT
ncbi:hypothetical protein MTR_4g026610 [Medicago truncatula]|uniref:Uncharacterized protein n=1 Tax=Medicago truncatula TaxID=3880 RepID=G7JH02_MEDTR|nr:hypothetical protein MTR_4g026610 [Medicago truncatula]